MLSLPPASLAAEVCACDDAAVVALLEAAVAAGHTDMVVLCRDFHKDMRTDSEAGKNNAVGNHRAGELAHLDYSSVHWATVVLLSVLVAY